MSEINNFPKSAEGYKYFEIRLRGHINERWADWLGDVRICPNEDGDTFLICPVIDQAAFYGLLKKVRDLNIPLISINLINPKQAK